MDESESPDSTVNHTVLAASSVAFDFAEGELFLAGLALGAGAACLGAALLVVFLGAALLACLGVYVGLALLTARLGVALLAVRAGAVMLPVACVAVCEEMAHAPVAMPATPTTATAAVITGAPAATAGRRRMDRTRAGLLWAVLSAFL